MVGVDAQLQTIWEKEHGGKPFRREMFYFLAISLEVSGEKVEVTLGH